jgi:prepilin-type N-terminal cleavage/methylation domain-containing protein
MMPATHQNHGFTLVELMCSMAIGSIILLAAASVLGSAGDGYARVSGGMAVEREARAVVAQITSDLSSAMFHKDGFFEKSTVSWFADRMGFLSLQPADAQADAGRIGDLCVVNYYLKNLTINGKSVRCLMRGFRDSRQTFAALGGDTIPSLFVEQSAIDEPVAFNVVSFEARPKSRDASGQWVDWIVNDGTGPAALEMRLIIARRNLAERLIGPGDWNNLKWLGDPSDAERNKDLEIYGAMIRFGNHEIP